MEDYSFLPCLGVKLKQSFFSESSGHSRCGYSKTEQTPSKLEGREAAGKQRLSCNLGASELYRAGGKKSASPLRVLAPSHSLHLTQSTWLWGLRHRHTGDEAALIPLIREAFVLSHFAARERVLQGQTTAICHRRAFRALNSNCAPVESPFRLVLQS